MMHLPLLRFGGTVTSIAESDHFTLLGSTFSAPNVTVPAEPNPVPSMRTLAPTLADSGVKRIPGGLAGSAGDTSNSSILIDCFPCGFIVMGCRPMGRFAGTLTVIVVSDQRVSD